MWTRRRLRYVTDEAAQAFGFFPESTRTITEQITTVYRKSIHMVAFYMLD